MNRGELLNTQLDLLEMICFFQLNFLKVIRQQLRVTSLPPHRSILK